jgi:hypothetical protein
MSENQEQRNQTDQLGGGLEHTTGASPHVQPEQTPSRHDGGRKRVGQGWSPWGMTLVN